MSAPERRRAILEAARPLFARHGFEGTTTRSLAAAAGISEALLYRHFPDKESLYRAIGEEHSEDHEVHAGAERLLRLPPSTERLVGTIDFLVRHVVEAPKEHDFPRLMARSLLEDGRFAASALARTRRELLGFLAASLRAAAEEGSLEAEAPDPETVLWLVQHLAFAVRLHLLPEPSPVPWRLRARGRCQRAV
ncbi:MAG: helix-turn-helix domain-containing protein, partial [Thermoanaerobaculia bacterium]|nr:helix-turn-helix domain-containing protein [Thermoanaerobaculia bacterium]